MEKITFRMEIGPGVLHIPIYPCSWFVVPIMMGTIWLAMYFQSPSCHLESSFTPSRSLAKWYVDGQDYMSAVADAIQTASSEIFITDWQMNPHIYMKRPGKGVRTAGEWRLDTMLLRKADQGVKIYILLYEEFLVRYLPLVPNDWLKRFLESQVLDNGNRYVPEFIDHENISILFHPRPNLLKLWANHEKSVVVDRSIAFIGGIDLAFGRWDTHSHELTDDYPCVGENKNCSFDHNHARCCRWPGKDYGNTFTGGPRTNFSKPMDDYVNRRNVSRLPWHDVGCSFTGQPAQDVSNYFIKRYNNHCQSCPKITSDREYSVIPNYSGHDVRIQVLLSAGWWTECEASIHYTYLEAIKNSKHFIYIESQFFIEVENKIMSALVDRIIRAYENDEDFHVVLILPLKPEFAEDWFAKGVNIQKILFDLISKTIKTGKHSLHNRLETANISTDQYFSVYGLRTHDTLNNKLITEIIYVHSKIMIVDDQVAIIGSANVNDRSMDGSRDSELAVIIEDLKMIDGWMNSQTFQVGSFSHSLRCHLMREHLGLLGNENNTISVEDPIDSTTLNQIKEIAKKNTDIYEQVFGPLIPSDNITSLKLPQYSRPSLLLEEARKNLHELNGRLLNYSLLFLKDYFSWWCYLPLGCFVCVFVAVTRLLY